MLFCIKKEKSQPARAKRLKRHRAARPERRGCCFKTMDSWNCLIESMNVEKHRSNTLRFKNRNMQANETHRVVTWNLTWSNTQTNIFKAHQRHLSPCQVSTCVDVCVWQGAARWTGEESSCSSYSVSQHKNAIPTILCNYNLQVFSFNRVKHISQKSCKISSDEVYKNYGCFSLLKLLLRGTGQLTPVHHSQVQVSMK